MKRVYLLGPLVLAVALTGCFRKKVEPPVVQLPQEPPVYIPTFYSDSKASKKGDLVTVNVMESSKGSKRMSSRANKESELSAKIKSPSNSPTYGLSTVNDYDSENGVERSGNLVANVTSMVMEVLPSGNLVIEGEREITIGRGVQILSVSGIVRPADISSNNTVISTRLAKAKIIYRAKKEPGIHRFGILGWFMNVIF